MHRKNLYLLLTANVLSHIGTGITMLAIPWILIKNLNATQTFGYMSIAGLLLGVVLLPCVGVIIDIFSRKKILILVAIFASITTTIVIFQNSYTLATLVLLYILGSAIYNFQFPTLFAFIQEVFPKDMYKKVNGLIIIQSQIAMMTAGGLAGIMLDKVPLAYILMLDASTYLIAAGLFLLLDYKKKSCKNKKDSKEKNSLWQGIVYLHKFPKKCIFLLCSLFPFVALSGFNYLIPIHVAYTLDAEANIFGWIEIFWALGAIFAGIIIPKLLDKFSIYKITNFCFVIFTLSMGFLSVNFLIVLFIANVFIMGWAHSSVRVVRNTALMYIVDNSEMGRVNTMLLAIGNVLQVSVIIILTNFVNYTGTFYCFFVLFLLLLGVFYLMIRNGNIVKK